mgnify:CR=1 FL=1
MEQGHEMPASGWTCFHCGETFTLVGLAEDHFGTRQHAETGCQIKKGHERNLLHQIRELENEIAHYRNETDEESKKYYARQSDHAQALIREEEKGYNKGVSDMRAELAAARDAALSDAAEIADGQGEPAVAMEIRALKATP